MRCTFHLYFDGLDYFSSWVLPYSSFWLHFNEAAWMCVGVCVCTLVAQLCPTLCDPMDCSPPGSSVHGILQARILEWVAISFSTSGVSQFSSIQLLSPDSLWPHEPQHTRPPCPSPIPGVHPNPCPSSRWCHPTISSSVVPFSSCPQSFPASGSFQMSQLFASGGQRSGVSASASVPPMNTQDWSPLGWTGWISL